tara:strand:- start:79 stop:642 length:564 start_codon:yes stop_codon:yes gene_type:complete
LQLPPASYDFSALYLPGTYPNTPRELFKDVFYPNENPFPLSYLDGYFFATLFEDVATRYKGTYIDSDPTLSRTQQPFLKFYLNTHLYGVVDEVEAREAKGLERNLKYAPFFLAYWEGQPMIGYVWEEDNKPVFAVGYLDENEWVYRPSSPRGSLQQNEGKGWYSDQFILFPMRSNYSVLNYPEGILN